MVEALSEHMKEITIDVIKSFLPHRYPFLLVDRVLEIQGEEYIRAVKNVTVNENFFNGHFPQKPVMPGVLIVEALAQAAAVLAYRAMKEINESAIFYLASIDNARFKRIVEPGDQLLLEVELIKRRKSVWKFKGIARVGNDVACIAEMTSMEG